MKDNLYELCMYCDPEGEEYRALKEQDIGVIHHILCEEHGLQLDAESQMYSTMGINGELAKLSNEMRKTLFPMLFGNQQKE